jgi:RNA polymerase sigma-70 factor (ECF subfamily)
MEAARVESGEAIVRLLEAYRPYLLALANEELQPALRAKEGASDLVQETIVKAQRDFEQFRGDGPAELVGWLKQILLNQIVDCTRRWKADKRSIERELSLDQGSSDRACQELEDAAPPPDLALLKLEEMSEMNRALQRMPSHFVQVILLRSRDKRSFEEIGEMLGRTPEAARKLWTRGLAELHRRLNRE